MKVRFQYTDFTEWEGLPEDAEKSPDIGIVRMIVFDDFNYELIFTYDDLYYLYPKDDGWLFGSGTAKREFLIKPGQKGCSGEEVPIILPKEAVIRRGETVSQEDAIKFGLIKTEAGEVLHDKIFLPVVRED